MNGQPKYARADDYQLQLKSMADCRVALELAMASGALLLHEKDISANCFDLSTGMLGELFQKFSNYNQKLAIVVAEPTGYGPRIVELIRDHRNHRNVRFFRTDAEAITWLHQSPE